MNRKFESQMERYLAGEMGPAEALEFRRQIEGDPARTQNLERDEAIVDALKHDRDLAAKDHTVARARAMESLKNATAIAHAEHARQMRNTSGFILIALLGIVVVGAAVLWWAVGEPAPIDESPSIVRVVDSTGAQPSDRRDDSVAASTQAPAADTAGAVANDGSRDVSQRNAGEAPRAQGRRDPPKPQDESAVQPPGAPPVPVYDNPVARGSINQRDEAK